MSSNITPIEFRHNYSFSQVRHAFLNKFPHPSEPNILRVEILSKNKIDHITYTERKIIVKNAAPWIFRKLLRREEIIMRDSLAYDELKQELKIKGWNETFKSFISATEQSRFYPDPNNVKTHTLFYQEGGITVGKMFGPLRSSLSKYTANRMRKEGIKACQILEDRCIEHYGKIIQDANKLF